MRTGAVKRKTKETDVEVAVDLDGTGASDDRDRHRLPRPHARSAGAALAHRHHGQGQGRPAHRPPPHHRGRRHRARPGGEAGARRHEGHHPLRRRAPADGRGADARRDRHFGRPFLVFKAEFVPRQGRRLRHRAGAGMVPGLRHERRRDAARRDASTAPTTTISPNPASRAWRGRCARRSPSIRAPPTRCRRPRARWAAERVADVSMRAYGDGKFWNECSCRLHRARTAARDGEAPARSGALRRSCATASHVWAFLFAPLWLLWHRLWLALVLYVVVRCGRRRGSALLGASRVGAWSSSRC